MTRVRTVLLQLAQDILQHAAMPLLWVGSLARPVLRAAAWCGDRAREAAAREWEPRLWDRDGNTRHELEDDDR